MGGREGGRKHKEREREKIRKKQRNKEKRKEGREKERERRQKGKLVYPSQYFYLNRTQDGPHYLGSFLVCYNTISGQ